MRRPAERAAARGDWWRYGVVYQIYPRSFADASGDGVGDLDGIRRRLDHLSWLGVDAVWLSPFYPSPMADFGYDVADHCDVDPLFGTMADFDRLHADARARGIRVIVDFVPNHTSDQHPWFAQSRSSRDDPKRDFYIWADPRADGSPPNNWLAAFERCGPAWTYDAATGQSYLHSFTARQPDLNWRNPRVRDAMDDVLRFWLDRSVDGFRVDTPHRILKDRRFRDNPPEVAHVRSPEAGEPGRQRNFHLPDVHEVLRRLRGVVDGYHDRVLVGEVITHDLEQWASYYGRGDEFDLVFNAAFWSRPWSAGAFRSVIERAEAVLPASAWPNYALGNHDIPRAATRFGVDGVDARARVAATMLLTLRGTPFLYYGEEIGMTDGEVPAALARDPAGRDPCRTPMQWDGSAGAGFTTGTPWLPVPDTVSRVNVAAQRNDPDSLLVLYRRLIRLRRETPALRHGDLHMRDGAGDVLAYERAADGQRVLVALNFGDTEIDLDLPTPGAVALSTDPNRTLEQADRETLRLRPVEGVVVLHE